MAVVLTFRERRQRLQEELRIGEGCAPPQRREKHARLVQDRRIPAAMRDSIYEQRKAGRKMVSIAADLGVSLATVHKYSRRSVETKDFRSSFAVLAAKYGIEST